MNLTAQSRTGPFWARAWTLSGIFVGAGALAVALDLAAGSVTPRLWWGLSDLGLGVAVAGVVLAVTGGHRPVLFRVGIGLLVLFVALFLGNLLLLALSSPG